MKKAIALAITIATSFTATAQILDYNELGILFSEERAFGSARFEALSGAFGALGGIPSSVNINPAGAAVAIQSPISFTLGVSSSGITSSYYGKKLETQNERFNLTQAGATLTFRTDYNSNWDRASLTFNYQLKNNFDKEFNVIGNSGVAYMDYHPDDSSNPKTKYDLGKEQRFSNSVSGHSSKFNFAFSGVYNKKIYVGASVNLHSLKFGQITQLNEKNESKDGNILTATNEQRRKFEGSGFSVGLGFIYKLSHSIRLGLAYESPTWYQEMLEDTNVLEDNIGHTKIRATDISAQFNSVDETRGFAFGLRAPSKITASGAFVFGKRGLLSLDYSYKNYAGISFSKGNFSDINSAYSKFFRAVHNLNIGTEWRFENLSVRSGYHFEQSPYKSAKQSDNINGFSAGIGYNFGNIKIDLAYIKDNHTGFYNIYPNNIPVNSVELSNKNSRILATVGFNL